MVIYIEGNAFLEIRYSEGCQGLEEGEMGSCCPTDTECRVVVNNVNIFPLWGLHTGER